MLEAGWGDFDSHANQPTMHADRMTEFNDAIEQFFLTLDPRWATRVTVMTFSEFGRTTFKNDGNGTDHGTANCAFVLGANVKGGTYGQHPNLAGLNRWDRVAYSVDYRSYYTSIMDSWLGGGASTVLGGVYPNLGLFAQGPGQGSATTPITGGGGGSTLPGYFVPLSPARVADTRDGTGGVPVRRVGPSELLTVAIAGHGGVPPTAIAVIANVTAVDVSEPTFLTVCPGGAARPETSNLNPVPGRATPNLVVMGLGAGGTIDVHNSVGDTNCIVDVFGYFDPSAVTACTRSSRVACSTRAAVSARPPGGWLASSGSTYRSPVEVVSRHRTSARSSSTSPSTSRHPTGSCRSVRVAKRSPKRRTSTSWPV